MGFRMLEVQNTEIFGVSREFDGAEYPSREALRHIMWSEDCDDVPAQICEDKWNQSDNHSFDGVWYGLWRNGRYMIAREKQHVRNENLEKQSIASGKYAAFRTEKGALAWEELPKLFELIFDSWLPDSGYKRIGEDIVEVYHLLSDHDERKKNRYYEVWVPVREK